MSLAPIAPRFVTLALLSFMAAPAAATEDCNEWFPDFNCENREARYEGFTPPTSMPYLFEDPFINTGISTHLIWHEFPGDSALRAGDLWVLAVQARLAITERLAFIATKDGFVWLRPGSNSEIPDDEGFFDIAFGFKYALIDMPEENFILTPSFRVDVPTGNNGVFSGNGDGVAIPAVAAGYGHGPFHLIADFGSRLPFNSNKESTSLFYNLHLDATFCECFIPFFEMNGTTWVRSANGERNIDTDSFGSVDLTLAQDVLKGAGVLGERRFEGLDIANLGSEGVAGHTIITFAFGGRIPINDHVSLAGYYEFPVTQRKGLFEQRAGMNLLLEF